jgi:hypothetical protein
MTPPSIDHLMLARGETRELQLAAGATLRVTEGCLRLVLPPRELAGLAHRHSLRLAAGDVHPMEDGGWVMLSAEDGPVRLQAMPPAPGALQRLWRTLLRLRARGLHHLRPLA